MQLHRHARIVPPGIRPVYGVPFYLQQNAIHKLVPGIQTGTTWNVDIHCPAAVTARPNTSSTEHREDVGGVTVVTDVATVTPLDVASR